MAISGIIVVIIGANLFDMSYQSVESLLKENSVIISNKSIITHQSVNYTIQTNMLKEHNVLIFHVTPTTGLIKLEVQEPNEMTFQKQSTDGYLYHIIQRNKQGAGYQITITNVGNNDVKIDVNLGEDPFLGKNCNASYGIKCGIVQLSMGLVVIGIIVSIVGLIMGIFDYRKRLSKKK